MNPSNTTSTRSLEDRLESFAEAWKPQAAGDKLIGTVVDVDIRDSDYGDPYPIVTVQRDDGSEAAFHGFHTVARRELAKKKPQFGDRIGIAYFGKGEPTKPGMSGAELYKIVVDQAEPQLVDWTAIDTSEEWRLPAGDDEPGPGPKLAGDEPPATAEGPDSDVPF